MDTYHQVIKYLDKMQFKLTQETNLEGSKNIQLIDFSNRMNEHLNDKSYGNDINHIFIGIICVKPEFEFFFKVRKPRYNSVERIKSFDGNITELKGVYEYDIKLDFTEYVSSSKIDSEKILTHEILNSLSNLDSLPKKVKHFDKKRFIADVEQFFKSEKLI